MPADYESAAEVIPAAGAIVDSVPLRGPSGGQLRMLLRGKASLSWLPLDKRAMDLEIRARAIAWIKHADHVGPSYEEPLLRWSLDIGHGNAVIPEPDRFRPNTPGVLKVATFGIPARGLIVRTTARELKVTMSYDGVMRPDGMHATGPHLHDDVLAPSEITMQVSIQPVVGLEVPVYPRQDYALVRGMITAFPPGAQEWRISDMYGRPFASGLTDVYIYGLNCMLSENDNLSMPRDRSEFADWTQIPFFGAGWQTLVPLSDVIDEDGSIDEIDRTYRPAIAEYR